MNKTDKYHIVCLTETEFKHYFNIFAHRLWNQGKDVSMSHFVFVYHPDQLRGIINVRGWFVGRFTQLNHIHEIIQVILMSKINYNYALTDDFRKLCYRMGVADI